MYRRTKPKLKWGFLLSFLVQRKYETQMRMRMRTKFRASVSSLILDFRLPLFFSLLLQICGHCLIKQFAVTSFPYFPIYFRRGHMAVLVHVLILRDGTAMFSSSECKSCAKVCGIWDPPKCTRLDWINTRNYTTCNQFCAQKFVFW